MAEHPSLKLKPHPSLVTAHPSFATVQEQTAKKKLTEAKSELAVFQRALLSVSESAGPNNVFIMDGLQLAGLSRAVETVVSAYNEVLDAAVAKTSASDLSEIKLVLGQIWQAISKNNDLPELQRKALQNLDRVLSQY